MVLHGVWNSDLKVTTDVATGRENEDAERDILMNSGSGDGGLGFLLVVAAEPGEELVEVVAGVGPVEGCSGGVVAILECQDSGGEVVEIGEVGRADRFALQDREVGS
jgi:hypothetical protein